MMKKILYGVSLIFLICLCLVLPTQAEFSASGEYESWSWNIDDNGLLTISGEGAMDFYGYTYRDVPWYDYTSEIKSVKIEEGITSVADYAFCNCYNLKDIVLPTSVVTIGKSTFSSCYELKNIDLPQNLTYIGESAFSVCNSLVDIKLPDGVEFIYDDTFTYCEGLSNIEFPQNLYGIGQRAFYNCTNLKSVKLPDPLAYISYAAFSNCSSLENLVLPEGLITIGSYAFADCSNLKDLTIPSNVTSVDDAAFSDCISLQKIYWNTDKISSFSSDCRIFEYSGSSLEFVVGQSVTKIPDNIFRNSSATSINILGEITNIGNCAFINNVHLVNISFPNTLTTIGNSILAGCENLKELTIPKNVSYIGNSAFSDCVGLEKIYWNAVQTNDFSDYYILFRYAGRNSTGIDVVFGDDVVEVPDCLFYHFYENPINVKSITIGKNVNKIGKDAFCGIGNLEKLYWNSTSLEECQYYDADYSLFSLPTEDSGTLDIVFGNDVKKIPAYALAGCDIVSLTIPEHVEYIGYKAFANCSKLEYLQYDNNNCKFYDYAYPYEHPDIFLNTGSENGFEVSFSKKVTEIPKYLLYGSYVSSVNISKSISAINEYAFYNCEYLKSIELLSNIKYIGKYAFYKCGRLKYIYWDISNNIDLNSLYIFGHAGYYTDGILAEFGSNVTTIPNSIFGCDSSGNIYAANIKVLSLSKYTRSVGESSFYGCNSITDIYYDGTIKEWENSTFADNYYFMSATVHCKESDVEDGQFSPTSTIIENDGSVVEIGAQDMVNNNYPKYTTIRPKTTNNIANLVGNWYVKNTTVETGEINSGVTISLSGDLIVENGVFKVTKGTTLNATSLKIGTNGKVLVEGKLYVGMGAELYGGSSKVSGGYLEINGDVRIGNCLKIEDYGYVKVNAKLYVGLDFEISTKNTNSTYTDSGSLWLTGDLIQKKGGLFASGNNFCPDDKFKFILNQNNVNAVHKLDFQSPKKSYINDLYIVKGTYDNFHDGNATIYGVTKNIKLANNENGYVFEEDTQDFKKSKSEWNTEFSKLFNTVSTNKGGYVSLTPNESYFKKEFGEKTYYALKAYFGMLCLCMNVEPASSFEFLSSKNNIPHEVNFINSDTKITDKKTFYISAMGSEDDAARIRYITYKDKRFCVLMLADIEPVGRKLQELVTSNYAEYYASLIGLSVNAFNNDPQKNIAKLLWEGVALSDFKGAGNVIEGQIGNFIKSDKFVDFVSKNCNFNPNKARGLTLSNYFNGITQIDLLSETESAINCEEEPISSMSENKGMFEDKNFENAIRTELSLSAEDEITTDMLSEITDLSLLGFNITNLKGIEFMTALETLDLSGNAISDISYISKLANLRELNLNGNNISDISAVKHLTTLEKLKLNSNNISDISPLTDLTALTVLDIGNNNIENITPLSQLTNITQLNMAYNIISELNALKDICNLEVLVAQNNNISNISEIISSKLRIVNLANNSVTDISVLLDDPLTKLDLSNNAISDISPLANKESIFSLVLNGTEVNNTSVEIIASLTALTELSIQNTSIDDISGFSDLSALENLSVANTNIIGLTELEKISTLKKLDISDVDISDFSFITNLINLEELYADNCALTDSYITEISLLTNLEVLSLASNHISNIDFVNRLSKLCYLDLSNNVDIPNEKIDAIKTEFENDGTTFICSFLNVSVTDIFMDNEKVNIEMDNPIIEFAQIYPYNAKKENVIFNSSNDSIVTYKNNILTPVREGTATITAQNVDGDIVAACEVRIIPKGIKAVIDSVEWTDTNVNIQIESVCSKDLENVDLILATYNKYNALTYTKMMVVDILAESKSSYTFENVTLDEEDSYYKIFIWDKNMCPLAVVETDTFDTENSNMILESAHPYTDNYDETQEYTYPQNCESINVTFSTDTLTEEGWDYIYIYDAYDNEIGCYSGSELAGQTINVPGNTIKIRLTSDGSNTEYGYRTESITANN